MMALLNMYVLPKLLMVLDPFTIYATVQLFAKIETPQKYLLCSTLWSMLTMNPRVWYSRPSMLLLQHHCVKSVQIRSFFWSEYRKIRTRKNSVSGHFSRSAGVLKQISNRKNQHCSGCSTNIFENSNRRKPSKFFTIYSVWQCFIYQPIRYSITFSKSCFQFNWQPVFIK